MKEWFKNREDMLDMREVNKQTQLTTEYFSPGHLFGLKGILVHLGNQDIMGICSSSCKSPKQQGCKHLG